jgi:hypothetical protein
MNSWGSETLSELDADFAVSAYVRIPQMTIVLGVQDACGKASDRTQDAMDWIFGAGGNFEGLALLAGWDADWLRRKVRKLIDSGVPMKRTSRQYGKSRQGRDFEDDVDEWESNDTPAPSSLRREPKHTTYQAGHSA